MEWKCRILYCWTNYEKRVDIYKYYLCFYSSTATFMWSGNKVRESSHISFFCVRDPFFEVVRRPENTHGRADRSAWVTSGSLPSLERPADLSPSIARPADLCLQSKIADLILSFQVPCGIMNLPLCPGILCLWLVIGTYIHPSFFW